MGLSLFWVTLSVLAWSDPESAFATKIEKWRVEREKALQAPHGWLSQVSLEWLKHGKNELKISDSSLQFHIELLENSEVRVHPIAGAKVKYDGAVVLAPVVLKLDSLSFDPTFEIADYHVQVIRRKPMGVGVRVRDPAAQTRKKFRGLRWFAPNESFVFQAKFTPYAESRAILTENSQGGKSEVKLVGDVEFAVYGKPMSLKAFESDGGGGLFLVFRDQTSGKSTYAAARFLDTDKPKDGFVTLDFNYAYNPPCAFTKYATCPYPPPGNTLPFALEAGEKAPKGH